MKRIDEQTVQFDSPDESRIALLFEFLIDENGMKPDEAKAWLKGLPAKVDALLTPELEDHVLTPLGLKRS